MYMYSPSVIKVSDWNGYQPAVAWITLCQYNKNGK